MRTIAAIVGAVAAMLGCDRPFAAEEAAPSAAQSTAAPAKVRRLTDDDAAALPADLRRLISLHAPLEPPKPGDWLDKYEEAGQTYAEYLQGDPVRATAERRTIWIQPIGLFTLEQRRIIRLTSEFLGIYFQLPVKTAEDVSLDVVPQCARRNRPGTIDEQQLLTSHVLDNVLKPRLPPDAVAYIAFTANDLWPGEGWNFVFGMASLRDRVGVWSINRFGDPGESDTAFRLALRRTLKTAAHETGHMLSIHHCTHFECAMNGSNHLEENDRHPLWLCPLCLAKLCHATGADPRRRFQELAKFAGEQKLTAEKEFWERSLKMLESDAAGNR